MNQHHMNHHRNIEKVKTPEKHAVQAGKSRQKDGLSIGRVKWAMIMLFVMVIGGVMSYGAVASIYGLLDDDTALSMVWMIIPMTGITLITLHCILTSIEKRMKQLTQAIDQVSQGNLEVELDPKHAGEYEQVFKGFNAMVRELKRTKEEMTQFTNDFAHEFKTPITSISGFSDYLYETGEGIEDEERMEYLKVIRDQSRRLVHMSQNTLVLSKAEACQVVTGRERFNIAEQIRECAIMLHHDMEEKKIELDMPEDMDAFYDGNEEQLQQIWINLLGNAVKFTPEGGKIQVYCYEESEPSDLDAPKALRIRIRDNGIGMDAETAAHVFDKYYQNDTVSLTKGNGIGLAIVKRLCDLYEGKVTVESELGKGTTFTVSLPCRES